MGFEEESHRGKYTIFHHISSRVHTICMIYDCWCWPWSRAETDLSCFLSYKIILIFPVSYCALEEEVTMYTKRKFYFYIFNPFSFFFFKVLFYWLWPQTEVVLVSTLCCSKSRVESFMYFMVKYHACFFWIHFIRLRNHLLLSKCQRVLNYKWMFNCYQIFVLHLRVFSYDFFPLYSIYAVNYIN